MKIKYVWHDESRREKIYDTIEAFEKLPNIFKSDRTQEEFDLHELQSMKEKKKEGLILSYEVIKDEITK